MSLTDRETQLAEQAHDDANAEEMFSVLGALPQCLHGETCGGIHSALNVCHGAAMRLILQSSLMAKLNSHDDLVAALAEVIYAYDVVDARDEESGYQLQMSMKSVMEQVRDAHHAANEVPA